MDCKRPNCFLCNSKILTGKGLRQDCSKRNILYEIKCITCEEIEMEKIELSTEDEDEKNELKKNIKTSKYIGESRI